MMVWRYIGLIVWCISISAQTTQELFLQANQWYAHKEYQRAYDQYQALPEKTATVLYNMGNCAYYLSQYHTALVCWLRAARTADRTLQQAIVHNCQMLARVYQLPDSYRVTSTDIIRAMIQQWSLLFWQVICLICTMSMLLIGIYYKRNKYALLLCGCVLWSLTSAALYIKYDAMHQQSALIAAEEVPIFSGPDRSYHRCATIPAYASVSVLEEYTGWYKVSYHPPTGHTTTGWVAADHVTLI